MNKLKSFGEFLNESAVDKYYDIKWVKKNEKEIYDNRVKIMDNAEKAMPVLAETLERLFPGKFDTSAIGFAWVGNAAFCLCNVKDYNDRFTEDMKLTDERHAKGEYSKYFDIGGSNTSSHIPMKEWTHTFRLKA